MLPRLIILLLLVGPWTLTGPAFGGSKTQPKDAAMQRLEPLLDRIKTLNQTGRYADALVVARQLGDVAKELKTEDSSEFATAVSWMAFLHQAQGQAKEAGPLFEQALKIYERVLPPDHPDLATGINNLGFEYQITGRFDEAEALYKRSLLIREKVLKADDPAIADSLNNIAQVYKSQDRVAEAEALLKRALAIRGRALSADDPRIAQSLQNLAGILELQTEFTAAELLLRRAVSIRRKSQVPNHPEVAGVVSKLGQNSVQAGPLQGSRGPAAGSTADLPQVAARQSPRHRQQFRRSRSDRAGAW